VARRSAEGSRPGPADRCRAGRALGAAATSVVARSCHGCRESAPGRGRRGRQSEFDERFGTWGGLAAASGLFGAVHALNFIGPDQDAKQALIAVPVISVLGAGLGLAYIRTGYRLETSVAMHFWYDFLLSTVAFALDPQNQPFVVQYGMAL
jgi:hypothetical protein